MFIKSIFIFFALIVMLTCLPEINGKKIKKLKIKRQSSEYFGDTGPSIYDNVDNFHDEYVRDRRGNYKIMKIELEKKPKKACSHKVKPFMKYEVRDGFDLEKLPKKNSNELMEKFNSLLYYLHSLRSETEHESQQPSNHMPNSQYYNQENYNNHEQYLPPPPPPPPPYYNKPCKKNNYEVENKKYEFRDSNREDYPRREPYYEEKYEDLRPSYDTPEYYPKPKPTTTTTRRPYTTTTKSPYVEPKPEYREPKPEYREPKPEYVEPKPEYVEPKPAYREPKFEYDTRPHYVDNFYYEEKTTKRPYVEPTKKTTTKRPYVPPTTTHKPYVDNKPYDNDYSDLYYDHDRYEHHRYQEEPKQEHYHPTTTTYRPTTEKSYNYKEQEVYSGKEVKSQAYYPPEPSYPEPYYEFKKYLEEDYPRKYYPEMSEYYHNHKPDYKINVQKVPCASGYQNDKSSLQNEFPRLYNPNRYESIKYKNSPVENPVALLKNFDRGPFLELESYKDSPYNYDEYFPRCKYDSNGKCLQDKEYTLAKRRTVDDKSEGDSKIVRDKTNNWEETKSVAGNSELLERLPSELDNTESRREHKMDDSKNNFGENLNEEVNNEENPHKTDKKHYETVIKQITDEIHNIRKFLHNRNSQTKPQIDKRYDNTQNDDDSEQNENTLLATDDDIQVKNRVRRDLFEKLRQSKESKKANKENFSLFKNKKEKKRHSNKPSLFNKKPTKKPLFAKEKSQNNKSLFSNRNTEKSSLFSKKHEQREKPSLFGRKN